MPLCRNRTTDCQSTTYGSNRCDYDRALTIGLTEVAFLGIARYIFKYLAKRFALEIGTIRIADEIEEHLSLFQHDLLDAQLFTIDSERHHTDKFFCHIGNLAKAVSQARPIGFKGGIQIMTVSQIVEFSIEQHTLGVIRNILVGEVHLDIRLESTVIDKVCRI